ncbi:MAG: hypothetical protein K2X81_19980 [Candidatus Obscuribacterales bacterium]|nr:hypothetical protein [Candidatus Obscuribacterales bacterium]
MNPLVTNYIGICNWDTAHYFIFSGNVFGTLIYYSHLLPLAASLLLGVFVISSRPRTTAAILLFLTIISIDIWLLFDLILWATEKPAFTMFFWSLINMIEPLIYGLFLIFLYYFIGKKAPSFKDFLFIILLLLPTVILTPTNYALTAFNLSNCNREAVEGIMVYYGYTVELIFTGWMLIYGLLKYRQEQRKAEKLQILLVTFSVIFALLSFAVGNVIGSFFVDWTIGQYGLFGIPVFVALLGYLIVRFKAFNIKLVATQALVASIWILTLAILFVRTIEIVRIVVSITLILFMILGTILVKSVNREIKQREQIEKLARDLEGVNKQQVILIHFITHQIKGFVAKSRNIFSLLRDGDFGPVPEPMKPMIEEGFRSDTKGAQTIAEILNAANIKSGKVEYTMQSFDLKTMIEDIIKDLQPAADAKHLTLHTSFDDVSFSGDKGQLINAFKNLIDNSIKYTVEGSVDLSLSKKDGKTVFTIKDTGVGISKEDMDHLFTEGGRGKNSQKINVESTGFGLYIVKNIIEAHKGTVRAESDGEGKGSRFIVELPG